MYVGEIYFYWFSSLIIAVLLNLLLFIDLQIKNIHICAYGKMKVNLYNLQMKM